MGEYRDTLKYIDMRIFIKEDRQDDIEELAEAIKDNIYDYDDELTPIVDVSYEIKEMK